MNEEQPTIKDKLSNQLGNSKAIVFSFDTTGSMRPCIEDVRIKLKELATELFSKIEGLRIGLIAHGDYCDGNDCIKVLDLTSDLDLILSFVHNTPNTSGGDAPECYELALNQASLLSWPESGGAVVLIGDTQPHEPKDNPDHLDWRDELDKLKGMNVVVFPVKCLNSHSVFWKDVAEICGTPLLELDNFKESGETLGAVAFASMGSSVDYAAYMCRTAGVSLGLGDTSKFEVNSANLKSFIATKEGEKENV